MGSGDLKLTTLRQSGRVLANFAKRRSLKQEMLTFLLMSKLSCYNGMDSCPGLYENALDENVRGQSNIMDINSMPVYAWNTGDQADDYGRAYGVTPDNFSEYGYNSGMPSAFAKEYSN